VPSVTKECT